MEREPGLAQGGLQVLSSPVCILGEGSNIEKESIPAGSSADLALDLIESQPLQDMVFIGEQVFQKADGKDCLMLEMGIQQKDDLGNDSGVNASVQESDAEFPVLSAENLRLAKEKEKFRGGEGKEVPKVAEQPNRDKKGKADGKFKNNHWAGGRNYKASLAEGVMEERNKPVSFEPDKIMKMGMLSESCGLPSIHFTSAETAFLAEKLGHAIVGKFSHSIPSSLHIQKALMGMKFRGEFSWKYINAKHVLVQFALIEDYAKLLSGPNGMPVWFVDRHPMRVFKWSTDFDPFFESPIAAVWCNLIGLPIHLFEKSALFAIGGLLGEPLQVDHATVTRSRLSFARLCIEIDISKTPAQEIMINFQGREIRQTVKWDRIPFYCHECKHVGHSSEVCYANGQREKPVRRDYKRAFDREARQEVGEEGAAPENGSLAASVRQEVRSSAGEGVDVEDGAVEELDNEGFLQQGRRRGKQGREKGDWGVSGLKGGQPGEGVQRGGFRDRGDGGGGSRDGAAGLAVDYGSSAFNPWPGRQEGAAPGGEMVRAEIGGSGNRFSVLSSLSLESEDLSFGQQARDAKPKFKYLKMLPNGDFDTEVYEDEKDWDDEEDGENDTMPQQEHLVEKRGADLELEKTVKQNNLKKGKLSEGAALVISSHVV